MLPCLFRFSTLIFTNIDIYAYFRCAIALCRGAAELPLRSLPRCCSPSPDDYALPFTTTAATLMPDAAAAAIFDCYADAAMPIYFTLRLLALLDAIACALFALCSCQRHIHERYMP